MTSTRNYTIPADRQYLLDEWMRRLAKIAKRIGVDAPTYTVVRQTRMADPTLACDIVGWVSTVPAIEVDVTIPRLRLDGFEWVATVKHHQVDGTYHNIVTTTDDEIGMAYTNAAPRCDRCGSKRNRAQTWIIRDEDGNLLMVGGNCQKDLLGHSGFAPKALLDWGEELDGGWDTPGADHKSPTEYVVHAQAIIREYGWAPTQDSNPTRSRVIRGEAKPTQEDADLAVAAIEALTNLENRTMFESNLFGALMNGRKARSNIGYLAYIPEWYRKHLEDQVVKEVVEETPVADVPVTADRVKVVGVVTSLYTRDTDYGTQHKMVVKSDEGYTVCGTEPRSLYPEVGTRVEFFATLTPSRDDSTFGFYNRPTQANILD